MERFAGLGPWRPPDCTQEAPGSPQTNSRQIENYDPHSFIAHACVEFLNVHVCARQKPHNPKGPSYIYIYIDIDICGSDLQDYVAYQWRLQWHICISVLGWCSGNWGPPDQFKNKFGLDTPKLKTKWFVPQLTIKTEGTTHFVFNSGVLKWIQWI